MSGYAKRIWNFVLSLVRREARSGIPAICAPEICKCALTPLTPDAVKEQLLQQLREREERIRFLERRITQLRIELGKAKDKTYFDDAYFHDGFPS